MDRLKSRRYGKYEQQLIEQIRKMYNEENIKIRKISDELEVPFPICRQICLNTHEKYYDPNYEPHIPHRVEISNDLLKTIRYDYNVLQKNVWQIKKEYKIKMRFENLQKILKNQELSFFDPEYFLNPRDKKRVEEYKKQYKENERKE